MPLDFVWNLNWALFGASTGTTPQLLNTGFQYGRFGNLPYNI
jgi:hypothetical protein